MYWKITISSYYGVISLKFSVQDEVVDSEQALYGNDDTGIEYNPVPSQKKQQKKYNDDDCKVIHEKDLKKNSIKATVKDDDSFGDDRVLHTSFNMSPYAINLISMIKRSHTSKRKSLMISSRPKVLLDITSSSIDSFFEMMEDDYIKISNINQLASQINASSGKVSIIQPKLKIDMGKEEELEHVDSLILSSVLTKIKMMSEEFGVSVSCIAEFLIYMYVSGSENPIYNGSKKYCEERMSTFRILLDKFILDCSQTNIEDENALIRIAYKMAVSNINESTRTNTNFKDICHKTMSIDVGNEFNINTKLVLRKKNDKRSYDESHSRGIFKQKTGRKSKKDGE